MILSGVANLTSYEIIGIKAFVFFYQCKSVLIRGEIVFRFSSHFEKNLIGKLQTGWNSV
jgi:hypothetical protein